MAYLDLSRALPAPVPVTAPPKPCRARLSRLERHVVLLSRRDGRWSLTPPGPFRRGIARVFGIRGTNRLADPRLEALRRFAVLQRRYGPALPSKEEFRLAQAGYSDGQMAHARALVGSKAGKRRPRLPTMRRFLALAAVMAGEWLFIFATDWLGASILGVIVALLAIVSAASLMARALVETGPAKGVRLI